MSPERFEELARKSGRTREELEAMRDNARDRQQHELVLIATEVLAERYPKTASRRAGPTPTRAIFRGQPKEFRTGKDAYAWLLNEIERHRPGTFARFSSSSQASDESGVRIAKSPSSLFPAGSPRSDKRSNYCELGGGWFANVNLSHKEKFETLLRVAALTDLEYPRDWDFLVYCSTEELRENQKLATRVKQMLRELDELT